MGDRRLWTAEVLCGSITGRLNHRSIGLDSRVQKMDPNCPRYERIIPQSGAIIQTNQIKVFSFIMRRWYNHLDPTISREPWTQPEELIIFEAHRRMGSKWKEIAKLLTARYQLL